jgi:hypothetical protein
MERVRDVSGDDPVTAESLEVRLGRLAKEALLLR